MSSETLPHMDSEAPWQIPDPGDDGAIDVRASGICEMNLASGAENRTLARPTFRNQRIILILGTDSGTSITVTVQGLAGGTLIFDAVGDYCELFGYKQGAVWVWRQMTTVVHGGYATS